MTEASIPTTTYNSLYELLEAFPDEESCVRHLEAIRWPNGIICPLCGSSRKIFRVSRAYAYKCADCKREFSVRKNTIFEESRLPLRKWFMASWLVTSHRKGIPSTQLARELGVTQKTAWFVLGRLREVWGQLDDAEGPVGGEVEVDETFIGGKSRNMHVSKRPKLGRGTVGKKPVAGARSRDGKVKAKAVTDTSKIKLHEFVRSNIAIGATLYTDENRAYWGLEDDYDHEAVNHSVGEYVRGQAHTNGLESFWALLKRGYIGTFHHFTWKHLHRYLAEFSARYNLGKTKGGWRVDTMLGATPGLRLTYDELIEKEQESEGAEGE